MSGDGGSLREQRVEMAGYKLKEVHGWILNTHDRVKSLDLKPGLELIGLNANHIFSTRKDVLPHGIKIIISKSVYTLHYKQKILT